MIQAFQVGQKVTAVDWGKAVVTAVGVKCAKTGRACVEVMTEWGTKQVVREVMVAA